ncbi:hypothetical protein IWQ62_003028 [Dispira parvispora]|uniref:WD40 repeat-like protein n=1 Tax=Dispira parvispora TaxID=1520584 RepID=A0A9W8ANR0_9FUNG|nr:hypothetical protein IWQ62_003028 [Dispira parvispora]
MDRKEHLSSVSLNDRDQVGRLLKEIKSLKRKIESLEEENQVLKRSLYELSIRYSQSVRSPQSRYQESCTPFQLKVNHPHAATPNGNSDLTDTHRGASSDDNRTFVTHPNEMNPANGESITNLSTGATNSHSTSPKESHSWIIPTPEEQHISNYGIATPPISETARTTGHSHASQPHSMLNTIPGDSTSALPNCTSRENSTASSDISLASDTRSRSSRFDRMGSGAHKDRASQRGRWNRLALINRAELQGHTGAVYTAKFSPNGTQIASGSFDKTVRIWDYAKGTACVTLFSHALNVSSLDWSSDGASILSGSFDKTCQITDLATQNTRYSVQCHGFVQCVAFHPQDNRLFFAGTSRNRLVFLDTRVAAPVASYKHPAMVNCLYVDAEGRAVYTGDSAGTLRQWDIRQAYASCTWRTKSTDVALSALSGYNPTHVHRHPYLTVNAYDDNLRVYEHPDRFPPSATDYPRLIYQDKGYRNRNWPIGNATTMRNLPRVVSEDPPEYRADLAGNGLSLSHDPTLLVATGSAEPFAYVYMIDPVTRLTNTQRLEGHSDLVNNVDFHPTELALCTCSSDFTLRLWAPNRDRTS